MNHIPGETVVRIDIPTLDAFSPPKWQDMVAPELEWAATGLIPQRNVTLLSGDGGGGKTLTTLQLQVAAACRKPWLGVDVQPMRSFGLSYYDAETELHPHMPH